MSEGSRETQGREREDASGNGAGPRSNGGAPAAPASEGAGTGAELISGAASAAAQAGGLARNALGAVTRWAQSRVPGADLDERDPDYIRESLPGLWLLASIYHRAEVRGLERIPAEGPVLLVGNHSGGNLAPDIGVFVLAFHTYFGVERRFHQLAHNLVLSMPGLGWLRKFGTVAASHENADAALDAGAALLVYPGGDWEVHRPSWEAGKVDFDGRKGFIRRALKKEVPIVPVVAAGGQETALFLTRGEGLARLLRLDRMFRLKVLPISLAPPFGLVVGDMIPGARLPLPAKITIRVLDPIDLRERYGKDPDVDEIYDDVIAAMQLALDDLQAERRFPVIG